MPNVEQHLAKVRSNKKDCEAALADLDIIETECKETYFENYPSL